MTIEHFEATERYMSQLPGSEVFEDLTSIMDSPVEAAASLVMLTATTYCLGMTRGQERQYLADWHASLRNECSAVYAHLREVRIWNYSMGFVGACGVPSYRAIIYQR
jgi:hypothetical protein